MMLEFFNKPALPLFIVLAAVLIALGPSATFVVGIFIFLYLDLRQSSDIYRGQKLHRDLASLTGVFKDDFRSCFHSFFSKECSRIYFLKIVPLVAVYIVMVAVLEKISPELFSHFVKSNENFTFITAFFFPTMNTHYNALKMQDELWGEVLRQIYAVSFSSSMVLCLSFLPRVDVISDLALRSLMKQKKIFNQCLRIPLAALLLLVVTISFVLIMANSPAAAGSGDFIFGKYGEHDVTRNNHYFLTLWVCVFLPPAHAYVFMLIWAQWKFYIKER